MFDGFSGQNDGEFTTTHDAADRSKSRCFESGGKHLFLTCSISSRIVAIFSG